MRRVKDPRLGFVTVTGVDLSDDLKNARVFISVLKDEELAATLEILNSAKSFIRSEVGRRIRLRTIPSLEFKIDEAIKYGDRIEKLLRELKEKT